MSGKVWTKGNPSIAIQTHDDKFHWNPYLEVQQLERQMNTPLAAFWWEEVEGALAMKWEWVPWSWGFINGTICKYRVERYKFNRWSSFSYFVWQVGGQQFELVMSLHITNHTEDRNVEKKKLPNDVVRRNEIWTIWSQLAEQYSWREKLCPWGTEELNVAMYCTAQYYIHSIGYWMNRPTMYVGLNPLKFIMVSS